MTTVTYLSPRLVWPDVFIDANNLDTVEAVLVVDQHPLPLSQDSVVGGVPGHPQPIGDSGQGEVLHRDPFQRPPQCPA